MVFVLPSRQSDIALIGDDLYAVLTAHETLGYVHKVGTVFVSLCGADLHHAVEVGQSLSWERAVDLVRSC